MNDSFYWRNHRDSLLTTSALNLFQILVTYDGDKFDSVKSEIDDKYVVAQGRPPLKKHGGVIQTQIRAFQEAGWVCFEERDGDSDRVISITDAGKQALKLLVELPDFLKAAPHFVIELLSRYQLNNPARPQISKNKDYDEKLDLSDIFPYWTLFKVIRCVENKITADELKRFVFKIQTKSEIDGCIDNIKNYRKDVEAGFESADLDKKYGEPLTGPISEPKYIMGRLGTQVGKTPSAVHKVSSNEWRLTDGYLTFIDSILNNEPIFRQYEDEIDWMAVHGKSVKLEEESAEAHQQGDAEDAEVESPIDDLIEDEDSIYSECLELLNSGSLNIILSGPPGTSKTWYARQIAGKILKGDSSRLYNVQFHPSYSYEDFVEGYTPSSEGSGSSFSLEPKTFRKACKAAQDNTEELHIIQIDEFSRGDPSRIFGELLTYIESDYREVPFVLPYSQKKFSIPKNLIILATMNPYDKSVSDLDDAMERRFERIAMNPDSELLKKFLDKSELASGEKARTIQFFQEANQVSPHGFGHAYFAAIKNTSDLERLWKYKLSYFFEKMFRFENNTFVRLEKLYKEIYESDDEPTEDVMVSIKE
jgi:5-methylcytosine-specific restriction protein B